MDIILLFHFFKHWIKFYWFILIVIVLCWNIRWINTGNVPKHNNCYEKARFKDFEDFLICLIFFNTLIECMRQVCRTSVQNKEKNNSNCIATNGLSNSFVLNSLISLIPFEFSKCHEFETNCLAPRFYLNTVCTNFSNKMLLVFSARFYLRFSWHPLNICQATKRMTYIAYSHF